MTTALFGIVALIAIALIGWAIAEAKYKTITYTRNEEETAVEDRAAEALKQNGYDELGIKDVIKTISTKGFDAV
ncbi:MAG: hypothetical protein J6P67_00960 [Bacteroidaceae bacterium]|nr:hypothetical protein [Bacteroidaceae bacterium]